MKNSMLTFSKFKQSGMTLIELVTVVLLLSVLVGVGSSQISSTDEMTLAQQARSFSNKLRHAQFLASNWGCEIVVSITPSKYEATSRTDLAAQGKTECGAGNVINDPATFEEFSITLENSASFTATQSFYFDSFGRPRNTGTGSLLTGNVSIDMTAGSATWRNTITPITGFVSLSSI